MKACWEQSRGTDRYLTLTGFRATPGSEVKKNERYCMYLVSRGTVEYITF